jgi:BirA family biotin operon repressor/biotin-[acetyl-CoA-carboxylase] ligase
MLMIAALKRLAGRESERLQDLAQALAASPDAVAVALRQAETSYGVALARHGDRYRLCSALDWLDRESILARLPDTAWRVRIAEECGSTNAELLRAARAGAGAGEVLAAELQTQGRGRRGRAWHAGLCSGLCFSLLWRFDQPPGGLSGLSHAVGVAVVRVLRRRAVPAQLKWPNDLLWRERKLGGILIEVHAEGANSCAAVVGIGINVRLSAHERSRIDQPAADLAQAGGASLVRSELLAALLLELEHVLTGFAGAGFAAVRSEWDRYHAHAGQEVELRFPDGGRLLGVALGVDDLGRLRVAGEHGVQAVTAGDVSLRTRK